jgi:hypothetical protein
MHCEYHYPSASVCNRLSLEFHICYNDISKDYLVSTLILYYIFHIMIRNIIIDTRQQSDVL